MKTASKFSILSLALFFIFNAAGAEARTLHKKIAKPATFHYEKIFYYQNGPSGTKSFAAHANQVDVLAPQTYSVDASGKVYGSVRSDILAIARKNHVKIMPLLTNAGFSMKGAEAFLDNPAAEAQAISFLTQEAVNQNYWGWQVDFEQVELSYRDKFSNFVDNLHQALSDQGKIVSVAVIPHVSEDPSDYKNDYWQRFIGVYDFAALASSSDFISLMSYDDPGSTGPVARYSWFEQVVKYALKFVPPSKLSVGVPFYFWQWNENSGQRVGIGGYKSIKKVLSRYRVKKGYDSSVSSAYISFKRRGVNYTLWYENDQSLKKKIALIKQYGLHGFSAWAIGLEVPKVYLAMD